MSSVGNPREAFLINIFVLFPIIPVLFFIPYIQISNVKLMYFDCLKLVFKIKYYIVDIKTWANSLKNNKL